MPPPSLSPSPLKLWRRGAALNFSCGRNQNRSPVAGTAELNRGDSTRGATGRRGKKSTVVHRWGFRDRIICVPDYLFAGAINVVPAAKNLSIRVSVRSLFINEIFIRLPVYQWISFIISVSHLFIYGFIYLLFNYVYTRLSVAISQLGQFIFTYFVYIYSRLLFLSSR